MKPTDWSLEWTTFLPRLLGALEVTLTAACITAAFEVSLDDAPWLPTLMVVLGMFVAHFDLRRRHLDLVAPMRVAKQWPVPVYLHGADLDNHQFSPEENRALDRSVRQAVRNLNER